MVLRLFTILSCFLGVFQGVNGWSSSSSRPTPTAWTSSSPLLTRMQQSSCRLSMVANNNEHNENVDTDDSQSLAGVVQNHQQRQQQRRQVLETMVVGGLAFWTVGVSSEPQPALALVKGNAPPPPKKSTSDKPKCTNVEECQAQAEIREQEVRDKEAQGPPPSVTSAGTRYRDLEDGSGPTVKEGDDVQVYFKVLKLGKRSYDGLSGEGTVVFSRGYALEDDEDKPGTTYFQTVVGSPFNIAAFNDALIGMQVGGIRRFAIMPQKGWEKSTKACDGGPGGRGAGGELRTDYVVVPTATMVDQEACFDPSKQPFPTTYAQRRRMAQRFDQSLIMEVQVAKKN